MLIDFRNITHVLKQTQQNLYAANACIANLRDTISSYTKTMTKLEAEIRFRTAEEMKMREDHEVERDGLMAAQEQLRRRLADAEERLKTHADSTSSSSRALASQVQGGLIA
jgi:hypothetical protein